MKSNHRIRFHTEVPEMMNTLIEAGRSADVRCIPLDGNLTSIEKLGPRKRTPLHAYQLTVLVPQEIGEAIMRHAELSCGLSQRNDAGWLVSGLYVMPAKNDMEAL